MKAIILAAGEGRRLRPLTLDRPKCLVEVGGKALLDYQLEVLRSQGISRIVLIKGYRAETLERPGVRSYVNSRYDETNMVWTLFCARQELSGTVVVSYGDIVYNREALRRLIDAPRDIAVVIDRDWEAYWRQRCADPLDDAESLKIDREGKIAEIGQPPACLADIQGQYIGLMKFSTKGLAVIADVFDRAVQNGSLDGKAPEKAYMTDLLQAVIKQGHGVWPVFIDGGWVEVDTVQDLSLAVTRERLARIGGTA